MSDNNAELIAKLREIGDGCYSSRVRMLALEAATALESATPRIVRSVDELDALPNYSVILDVHGDAWQRRGMLSLWFRNGGGRTAIPYDRGLLPATVLFTPTESGEPQ